MTQTTTVIQKATFQNGERLLFCLIPPNVLRYMTWHMYVCNISFSPEQRAGCDPLTHIPFGWGPRQCIGKRFALMEMKMALVHCFRRYKFVRVPETQVRLTLLAIHESHELYKK